MADRKFCSHGVDDPQLILVTWCARCSGWRCSRHGVPLGSPLAFASLEVLENHFLPQEETTPEELSAVIQRAFVAAQESATERGGKRVY